MSQPFASSWKDLGKLSERLESEDKKNGIAICGPRPSRRGSDRATWNRALEAIVPLPETVRTQPSHDYTYGSRMMALNPDTTCLYRATIVSGGRVLQCLVIVETPASLAAHLLVTNPDAKAQGVVIAYDGRHGSNNTQILLQGSTQHPQSTTATASNQAGIDSDECCTNDGQ
ncbi:unnamed protein product [Tilletia laevis]|nr:hypothetical protein CF335_g9366 [Tilletia laevis]CAD6960917.1 unnamed protein product [Tilletia laevis]CAD6977518.1 unnamed protein product [Tilletia controversa]